MTTNPYEKAWEAMAESHDCDATGYLMSGERPHPFCMVAVCDDEPCMTLGRLYAEASGYGPAHLHRYDGDGDAE